MNVSCAGIIIRGMTDAGMLQTACHTHRVMCIHKPFTGLLQPAYHIHVCVYIYIYIYILYRERKREGERERETEKEIATLGYRVSI